MSESITSEIPGKPPTLADVARLAGVSTGTASKVLNGRKGLRPETHERVHAAARQLAFRPNPLARGLLVGRTGTVGLLTNDLEGRFSLPILIGAEDALGAGNLSVFLCDARGDAIREQHHLKALLDRRVDGLIVVADKAAPRPSLGRNLPVPTCYAYGASTDPLDMSVVTDNVQAGRIGAEHLLTVGRRRIAYVGGDATYTAATERAAGAMQAVEAAGLSLVGPLLYGTWSEKWGRKAARILLESSPDVDAIMCGSDQIARGVMDTLRESGRAIPEDIAVLGHDNWEIFAAQARPPLSSVDMNFEQLGRLAAELLFDAIEGNPRPGYHAVPCRVITRDSTM